MGHVAQHGVDRAAMPALMVRPYRGGRRAVRLQITRIGRDEVCRLSALDQRECVGNSARRRPARIPGDGKPPAERVLRNRVGDEGWPRVKSVTSAKEWPLTS